LGAGWLHSRSGGLPQPQPTFRPGPPADLADRDRSRRLCGPRLPRKGIAAMAAATDAPAVESGFRGNDKLLLGIVLAVAAFWLFVMTAGTVAPAILEDINAGREY